MPIPDGCDYTMHFGDCVPHMASMPDASVDFAVFSPPFPALYAYTSEMCDLGNSDDLRTEAKLHLGFFYKQLRRIVKPGRVVCVHVMNIPRLLRNGEPGTFDYRGTNIRLGERAGMHYQYDWLVAKNPQSQAIRTHAHSLLFVTLERDRAQTRGALADYLIKFLMPGDNAVPISSSEITRNEWIQWAEAAWPWKDIRETNTLNAAAGRGENDTKHICPLQLRVIERLIKLYTNPGEIVFSPFAGIGSEGYQAMRLGRRFYGCEIKQEYYDAAIGNLEKAKRMRAEDQKTLWTDTETTKDVELDTTADS